MAGPHTPFAHTPERQTAAAFAGVQGPKPFANCGVQTCVFTLQKLPAAQSASTLQPKRGAHNPFRLQLPERQTRPVCGVQGPSPLAKPQRLSESQTPERQTAAAFAAVQGPMPLANCGVQVLVFVLQKLPAAQSASARQPPAGLHRPFTLHAPERQTAAPVCAVQGPSPFAKPQRLSFASQTPLWQTRAAAAAVHVPFKVGFVWAGSVGNAEPFTSCGVQMCVVSLHQFPAGQLLSTVQAPPPPRLLPPRPNTPSKTPPSFPSACRRDRLLPNILAISSKRWLIKGSTKTTCYDTPLAATSRFEAARLRIGSTPIATSLTMMPCSSIRYPIGVANIAYKREISHCFCTAMG